MGVALAIETALRTSVALLLLPGALVAYSFAAWVVAFSGASAADVHRIYVAFSRLCLRIAGTRVELHGAEPVEPDRAYVVVPNHASNWDPLCIVSALPHLCLRFIAKWELMRIPIVGHALRRTGNVTVVRTETAGDVERIRAGMSRRDPAVSILFFAEGTRSRDGALHAFKKGAFATALGFRLPVLPIGVAGTYAIWPKGTLRLRRGTVVIEVGKPISTESLTLDQRDALRDRTHGAVAELRARARQRMRDRGLDPGGQD